MIGSASLPVFIALFGYGSSLVMMGVVIAAVIVSRHIDNIKRLIKGEENEFSLSKKR
jgi:glycerol-3-phosphate acyltransferase PlsY